MLALDLTSHWAGILAAAVFILTYGLVIAEEYALLRKSKAVILAAGIIWSLIGYQYAQAGFLTDAEEAIHRFLLEFAALFLFLLTAMTYVNALSERRVFDALQSWLVRRSFSYRNLFWSLERWLLCSRRSWIT